MGLVVITRKFGIVGHDSQLAGRTEKVQGGYLAETIKAKARNTAWPMAVPKIIDKSLVCSILCNDKILNELRGFQSDARNASDISAGPRVRPLGSRGAH